MKTQAQEQAQKHVDRMDKAVTAKIDERAKMLGIITPTIQVFYDRRKEQLAKRKESLVEIDFSESSDWDTLMVGLGMLFQAERKSNRQAERENKGLLAFVYRTTFEFSTSVGQSERDRLQVVFGLKGITDTPNKALLKKLNALQHRPLCVSQSIMLGEVSFKMDETLASFAKKVVQSNYVYVGNDETKSIDFPYMRDFIGANWEDLKPLKTVTALMGYFTIQKGYALSEEQEVKNKAQRAQERITKAVENALVKGGGKASIDNTNMSTEHKSIACAKLDKRLASMGYYPISASVALYQTLRYMTGSKDQETLERAIEELASIKAKLEAKLLTTMRQEHGERLAQEVRTGQELGMVDDNGRVSIPLPVVAD